MNASCSTYELNLHLSEFSNFDSASACWPTLTAWTPSSLSASASQLAGGVTDTEPDPHFGSSLWPLQNCFLQSRLLFTSLSVQSVSGGAAAAVHFSFITACAPFGPISSRA